MAVGPQRPPPGGGGGSDDEDDEDGGGAGGAGSGEDDDDAARDPYNLPVTHEVVLKGACRCRLLAARCCAGAHALPLRAGHSKLVSALDVEHTGSRVVTGGCATRVLAAVHPRARV
jgi:hypothetical protein